VDGAVRGAVGDAVDGAVGNAVATRAVLDAVSRGWSYRLGGQFGIGGWYWGSPSYVSFFREICGLQLSDDMAARAIAYAGTCESACWWWPHRDFVMVCERPSAIRRDTQGRLHSENSLAIEWPDGWGVASVHGTRVPEDVVLAPGSITIARIDSEQNAEVRRVMLERYGLSRYVLESGAEVLHEDVDQLGFPRRLLRKSAGAGLPALVRVHVKNSTLEPDGSRRDYLLPVHPQLRPIHETGFGAVQKFTCHNAVASTFGLLGEEYHPEMET
jgi:hypothetical protein